MTLSIFHATPRTHVLKLLKPDYWPTSFDWVTPPTRPMLLAQLYALACRDYKTLCSTEWHWYSGSYAHRLYEAHPDMFQLVPAAPTVTQTYCLACGSCSSSGLSYSYFADRCAMCTSAYLCGLTNFPDTAPTAQAQFLSYFTLEVQQSVFARLIANDTLKNSC